MVHIIRHGRGLAGVSPQARDMVDVRISGGPCVNLIPDESMGPVSDDGLP